MSVKVAGLWAHPTTSASRPIIADRKWRSNSNWQNYHGYPEFRSGRGLPIIARRNQALTEPISLEWRLNHSRHFQQLGGRG